MKNILENLIRENDFLEDGLYHGYINLTSLATYLLPKIEKISGKKSTVPSLTMTLSRVARNIQSDDYVRIRPEEITIRTGIEFITFAPTPEISQELFELYRDVPDSQHSERYLSISETSGTFSLIYSHDFSAHIHDISTRCDVVRSQSSLALLIVHISEQSLMKKGIIYFITKQLSYFGVNIFQMRTSLTQIALLIDAGDVKVALSILG